MSIPDDFEIPTAFTTLPIYAWMLAMSGGYLIYVVWHHRDVFLAPPGIDVLVLGVHVLVLCAIFIYTAVTMWELGADCVNSIRYWVREEYTEGTDS